MRLVRAGIVTSLLAVVAALGGCAGPQARTMVPGPEIPITEVKPVAGKWGGVVKGLPGPPDGDWVDLVIREDGTSEFASFRTIGAALGGGTLTPRDGKLVTEGERAGGTFTLSERGGKPLLLFQGVLRARGLPFTAELTRAK
jgi:hypothetical protein